MLNYQTFKITQGRGTFKTGNELKRIIPTYLKVLFPILCLGFFGG